LPPATIGEIPFHERPVRELLHLDEDRAAPVADYAGYGWARVPAIALVDAAGARRVVNDAVVLALHTADDAPAHADDLELELDVPDGSVAVMLSRFLAVWLPRLPADAGALVLAVCNPHATRLPRPPAATAPVHVPAGDVTSWMDRDTGEIQLEASAWSRVDP
jgi:hypothetical protein